MATIYDISPSSSQTKPEYKNDEPVTNLDLLDMQMNPDYSLYNARLLAKLMVGIWKTDLNKSDPMGYFFKRLEVGIVKRMVFDRIEIKLTIKMENDVLWSNLHLPFGIRPIDWAVDGSEGHDDDPDLGKWTGHCRLVLDTMASYNNNYPIPMIQRIRKNPKFGTIYETRCVVPDDTYGKMLIMQYRLEMSNETIFLRRFLKPC